MSDSGADKVLESTLRYYETRADEYDATAWEHPDVDPETLERVKVTLGGLSAVDTLDIGCGTGYLSRWLPGSVTLLDASPAMLAIATRRVPRAKAVQAVVPWLPFGAQMFGRAFAGNLYGHLRLSDRQSLVGEMLRVADELVILDELSSTGTFAEGTESRPLRDGSSFVIYKCHFTIDRLLEEVGGGEVLMNGPELAIIRRRRDLV